MTDAQGRLNAPEDPGNQKNAYCRVKRSMAYNTVATNSMAIKVISTL
jgi:hypothetical protein